MQKNHSILASHYAFTQNRELSWLQFNRRVLEEAADHRVPVLERLKFISIFSSNLDEFFMVRVGSLFDLQKACPNDVDHRSGMTPAQQLDAIYAAIPGLMARKKEIYSEVYRELRSRGIMDLGYDELTPDEQKLVKLYFKSSILPVLSPIIIGSHHPVPHLENKGLYVFARLLDKQGKYSIGLIPVPDSIPPVLILSEHNPLRFIRTETIILQLAYRLFGAYMIQESVLATVTRNADLSFDDDKFEDIAFDFRNRVSSLLKNRDHLNIVRLVLGGGVSDAFRSRLARLVHVGQNQIYMDSCPLRMNYAFRIADQAAQTGTDSLLYPPYVPRWPEDIDPKFSILEQVRRRDQLLFFPFDSTEPFLQLLTEAAESKEVVSIKITIYRLASSSKIARLLCRAAENGKDVMVMMELRARFDEANNIQWSKMLESAGCQVIYGIEDFKCHSKICQITMRSKGKLHYITQIGTGNYNEKTNTMYTDLSLMTASPEIGEDATAFFQNLMVNNLQGEYRHLLVSPDGIEHAVCRLIDEEIRKGPEGYVCVKINSLTDCEIIEKLVEASQAGVQVQMIIRGICCLLPGVPGYTDHIQVTSIVGRFLEHARIYVFGRGRDARVYLSSADFMDRNLHHRVEIACPVYDREIREELLWILSQQMQDNVKASAVTPEGLYQRKSANGADPVSCQDEFMDGSIHKAAIFIPRKKNLRDRLYLLLTHLSDRLGETG